MLNTLTLYSTLSLMAAELVVTIKNMLLTMA
jgi:hypothetical protein